MRYAALDKKKKKEGKPVLHDHHGHCIQDFNLNSRVAIWIFHPLLVPALDQLLAALHTHRASSVDGVYMRVPGK